MPALSTQIVAPTSLTDNVSVPNGKPVAPAVGVTELTDRGYRHDIPQDVLAHDPFANFTV